MLAYAKRVHVQNLKVFHNLRLIISYVPLCHSIANNYDEKRWNISTRIIFIVLSYKALHSLVFYIRYAACVQIDERVHAKFMNWNVRDKKNQSLSCMYFHAMLLLLLIFVSLLLSIIFHCFEYRQLNKLLYADNAIGRDGGRQRKNNKKRRTVTSKYFVHMNVSICPGEFILLNIQTSMRTYLARYLAMQINMHTNFNVYDWHENFASYCIL